VEQCSTGTQDLATIAASAALSLSDLCADGVDAEGEHPVRLCRFPGSE